MEVRDIRNERLGLKMVKNLERRNFEAYYCPTASDACEKVLSLIPEGSSISWGGSMTIRDIGLTKKLHEGNYTVIDRDLAKNDEEKNDCYLLDENLATMRTPYGLFSRFLRTDKVKWRYEVYRIEEDLGPITSFLYTIRNGWNGLRKWIKYVKRIRS